LYVGGLDPRVTEEVLRQIFETTGHVQSVKIIPDKTVSSTKSTKIDPLEPKDFITTCLSMGARAFFSAVLPFNLLNCYLDNPVAKRNFTTVPIERPQLRLR
jgi:hypothetical protein